jgi:integrase/recombinase XerD
MDASTLLLPIPVVTIFVRHSDHCKGRDGKERDESYKSCKCPKHLRWSFAGKQFRLSCRTRVWTVAEQKPREIEAQFQTDPAPASFVRKPEAKPTIERAIELFLMGQRSESVGASVLGKYNRELGRLGDFMAERSRFFPVPVLSS